MDLPIFSDVLKAYNLIRKKIHKTEVLSSSGINEIVGAKLLFKCENFQKVGAFKFRGASNAVWSLTDVEAQKGVATHSSGNHAAALALAARQRGVQAYIVMPENAPIVKQEAVKAYGGEITFCENTLEARESKLKEVQKKTGAYFVHPYDNKRVIAGQGTMGLEFIQQVKNMDAIIVPVGGGGLLAGTCLSIKSLSPNTKIIAAEPSGADDAFRSFKAGHIIPSTNPDTIADGLLTSLGQRNFDIVQRHVDEIVTVDDEYIIKAMKLIWERMKIIVEPSAAIGLGALLQKKLTEDYRELGIVLTGGNLDFSKLPFQ